MAYSSNKGFWSGCCRAPRFRVLTSGGLVSFKVAGFRTWAISVLLGL